MKRKRLTQVFPFLLPIRKWQRKKLFYSACQRSLAIVQAFWYNGEKEDRREEEWNSGNRITGEMW